MGPRLGARDFASWGDKGRKLDGTHGGRTIHSGSLPRWVSHWGCIWNRAKMHHYACATPVATRGHIYLIKSSLLPSGVVGGTPTGDVYVCAWVLCMMRACVSYQYAMQPPYLESVRGDLPRHCCLPLPSCPIHCML